MADKVAGIKIRVNAADLKNLDKNVKAPAAKIEETLTGAIAKWIRQSGKEVVGFGSRVKGTLTSISKMRITADGVFAAFHKMDVKALALSRKIKGYFKDAFDGARGSGKGNALSAGGVALGTIGGNLASAGLNAAVSTGTELIQEANKVAEAANRISISSRAAGAPMPTRGS